MMCGEEVGMPGARLTGRDREVIERGLAAGLAVGQIAAVLGKHRTTVARELRRGSGTRVDVATRAPARPAGSGRRVRARGMGCGGRPATYRASVAQQRSQGRARRPKPFKLTGELALVVAGLLQANWSP